ncbi:MAG: hypothetical protein LC779_08425 [Actinobacteria bacterium]|nr:hypothetical protein [Actinomycetota bacterium]
MIVSSLTPGMGVPDVVPPLVVPDVPDVVPLVALVDEPEVDDEPDVPLVPVVEVALPLSPVVPVVPVVAPVSEPVVVPLEAVPVVPVVSPPEVSPPSVTPLGVEPGVPCPLPGLSLPPLGFSSSSPGVASASDPVGSAATSTSSGRSSPGASTAERTSTSPLIIARTVVMAKSVRWWPCKSDASRVMEITAMAVHPLNEVQPPKSRDSTSTGGVRREFLDNSSRTSRQDVVTVLTLRR